MIQVAYSDADQAVKIFNGSLCVVIPDKIAENLPLRAKAICDALYDIEYRVSGQARVLEGPEAADLFVELAELLANCVIAETPLEFKTKAGLVEEVVASGAALFDHAAELGSLGLVKTETIQDETVYEWQRDVLIMLDKTQLQQILDGEAPEVLEQREVITAKHFVPDKKAFDKNGDLRQRIAAKLKKRLAATIEERPERHGMITCDWMHFDIHGILTEDDFQAQLNGAIERFADQIDQHGLTEPVTPCRFHTFPPTQYGMAYLDWVGKDFPFDIRVIIRFGNFVDPASKLTTPGFRYFLNTVIDWDEEAFDGMEAIE